MANIAWGHAEPPQAEAKASPYARFAHAYHPSRSAASAAAQCAAWASCQRTRAVSAVPRFIARRTPTTSSIGPGGTVPSASRAADGFRARKAASALASRSRPARS